MKKLLAVVALSLAVSGLYPGRSDAGLRCCFFWCTPQGYVGQYNAFTPVYEQKPQCAQNDDSWRYNAFTPVCKEKKPCPDKNAPWQFNAFSPVVGDCPGKCGCSFLHPCKIKAAPLDYCVPNLQSCEWGCQGELPDAGALQGGHPAQSSQGWTGPISNYLGLHPGMAATPSMPVAVDH